MCRKLQVNGHLPIEPRFPQIGLTIATCTSMVGQKLKHQGVRIIRNALCMLHLRCGLFWGILPFVGFNNFDSFRSRLAWFFALAPHWSSRFLLECWWLWLWLWCIFSCSVGFPRCRWLRLWLRLRLRLRLRLLLWLWLWLFLWFLFNCYRLFTNSWRLLSIYYLTIL